MHVGSGRLFGATPQCDNDDIRITFKMKILAVVVDNNDYLKPHNLTNAIADAQAMADVFVRLGYDTKTIYNFR